MARRAVVGRTTTPESILEQDATSTGICLFDERPTYVRCHQAAAQWRDFEGFSTAEWTHIDVDVHAWYGQLRQIERPDLPPWPAFIFGRREFIQEISNIGQGAMDSEISRIAGDQKLGAVSKQRFRWVRLLEFVTGAPAFGIFEQPPAHCIYNSPFSRDVTITRHFFTSCPRATAYVAMHHALAATMPTHEPGTTRFLDDVHEFTLRPGLQRNNFIRECVKGLAVSADRPLVYLRIIMSALNFYEFRYLKHIGNNRDCQEWQESTSWLESKKKDLISRLENGQFADMMRTLEQRQWNGEEFFPELSESTEAFFEDTTANGAIAAAERSDLAVERSLGEIREVVEDDIPGDPVGQVKHIDDSLEGIDQILGECLMSSPPGSVASSTASFDWSSVGPKSFTVPGNTMREEDIESLDLREDWSAVPLAAKLLPEKQKQLNGTVGIKSDSGSILCQSRPTIANDSAAEKLRIRLEDKESRKLKKDRQKIRRQEQKNTMSDRLKEKAERVEQEKERAKVRAQEKRRRRDECTRREELTRQEERAKEDSRAKEEDAEAKTSAEPVMFQERPIVVEAAPVNVPALASERSTSEAPAPEPSFCDEVALPDMQHATLTDTPHEGIKDVVHVACSDTMKGCPNETEASHATASLGPTDCAEAAEEPGLSVHAGSAEYKGSWGVTEAIQSNRGRLVDEADDTQRPNNTCGAVESGQQSNSPAQSLAISTTGLAARPNDESAASELSDDMVYVGYRIGPTALGCAAGEKTCGWPITPSSTRREEPRNGAAMETPGRHEIFCHWPRVADTICKFDWRGNGDDTALHTARTPWSSEAYARHRASLHPAERDALFAQTVIPADQADMSQQPMYWMPVPASQHTALDVPIAPGYNVYETEKPSGQDDEDVKDLKRRELHFIKWILRINGEYSPETFYNRKECGRGRSASFNKAEGTNTEMVEPCGPVAGSEIDATEELWLNVAERDAFWFDGLDCE